MVKYRGIPSPPVLFKGQTVEILPLEIKTRLAILRTWDDLPKVEFKEHICKDMFENFIAPLIGRDDWGPAIFDRLEHVKDANENLRLQIQRLTLRLMLYSRITTKNGYAIDPREYLRYSLVYGPTFANWLSKARAAMTIKSLSSRLLDKNAQFIKEIEENIYGIVLVKEKYDYDSFLNERYLIDFLDTGSDFHWAFEDVHEDEDMLEKFRFTARALLISHKVSDIEPPTDDDYARWISDSITQTDDGATINRVLLRKHAVEKTISPLMKGNGEPQPLVFKRQVVCIEPGNVRDTWQCYPDTLCYKKSIAFIKAGVRAPALFNYGKSVKGYP
jgi:hypothetical protein